MTAETSGAIVVIGSSGRLDIDGNVAPEDGLFTLRLHGGTARAVEFCIRALMTSGELKVVSMVPIPGDSTEVVLDLTTPEHAASFLDQLKMEFDAG